MRNVRWRDLGRQVGVVYLLVVTLLGLFFVRSTSSVTVPAILRAALVSTLFLSPVLLLIHFVLGRLASEWRKVVVALFLIFPLATFLSGYFIIWLGLTGGLTWKPLADPPLPLVDLVSTSPIGMFGGEVYARDASGQLYAYVCDDLCTWVPQDALPPPPDPDDYWSGTCRAGEESPRYHRWFPPEPGRVVDSYTTTYCGPDYAMTTWFVLLDDGTVWARGQMADMASVFSIIGWSLGGGLLMLLFATIFSSRKNQSA